MALKKRAREFKKRAREENALNKEYAKFNEEWSQKYPNKDKFENWANSLTKEQLKMVDEYVKGIQKQNKAYLDEVKKCCKSAINKEDLHKKIKKIR